MDCKNIWVILTLEMLYTSVAPCVRFLAIILYAAIITIMAQ